MGLDTTHNAWHGSYSSFNQWRTWLADKVGISLQKMEGFGGDIEWTEEMKEQNYYPLLYHSDCDGDLSIEECKKIKSFLEKILDTKPNVDKDRLIDWNYAHTLSFFQGCQKAIEANEPIEFR